MNSAMNCRILYAPIHFHTLHMLQYTSIPSIVHPTVNKFSKKVRSRNIVKIAKS